MNVSTIKTRLFATIIIALLIASITVTAVTIVPVKAQVTSLPPGVTTIGPPQVNYYQGGAIPTGVTPSLTIPTIPYISFSPNPNGVNQNLLVNLWLQPTLPVYRAHTNYTVYITKPDGTTETVGPLDSYVADTTCWFGYTPTQAGNYTFQFAFGGDYYPAGYYVDGQLAPNGNYQVMFNGVMTNATYIGPGDVYYAPSESAKYILVVQPNFVARWPPSALPGAGDYWSEPISPNNREWWIIGGWDPNNELGGPDWPANTNTYTDNYLYNFVPYVTGPTSSHIVWRMQTPTADDGIVGGYFYDTPSLYQASWEDFAGVEESFGNTGPGVNGNPSIAYDGRGYITLKTTYDGVVQSVWECFNIQTGQVYWQHTGITNPPTLVSISQASPPIPGATSRASLTTPYLVYLSTSRIIEYDPISGAVVNNVTLPASPGFSSSVLYADPYVLSIQNIGTSANPNYRLINWTLDGIGTATTAALFQAQILNNITWPFPTIGYPDYETGISGYVYSATVPQTAVGANVLIAAASLTTGQLLWNESSGVPFSVFTNNEISDHGLMAVRFDNGYWYAWNLQTGKLAWQSQLSSYPWGVFGAYHSASAYDLLYYPQYDGICAYNWTTGAVQWLFQAPTPPEEGPYTNGTGQLNSQVQPFFTNVILANGICYTYSQEHSPTAPLSRGWTAFAINATTGALIWSCPDPISPGVVADGYMTGTDFYLGYMDVFGMGQSATTISPMTGQITAGQTVTISGTVMDASPATTTTSEIAPDQPVPCVSDASMGTWMGYLYEQLPINGIWGNETITGVPITIYATDPSGTTTNLGTVTTDGTTGAFGLVWNPTTPGTYKINVVYAGDDSYASSSAATYTTIVAAPTPTATGSPTTLTSSVSNSDMILYFAITAIAIIIAIAIATVLLLRKKP